MFKINDPDTLHTRLIESIELMTSAPLYRWVSWDTNGESEVEQRVKFHTDASTKQHGLFKPPSHILSDELIKHFSEELDTLNSLLCTVLTIMEDLNTYDRLKEHDILTEVTVEPIMGQQLAAWFDWVILRDDPAANETMIKINHKLDKIYTLS